MRSERRAELFGSAVDALAPVLVSGLDAPILLHAAYYTCFTTDPAVGMYPGAARHSASMNTWLAQFGDMLRTAFGDRIQVFDPSPRWHRADANHRWGLSHYHYERDYYLDLLDAIEAVVDGRTHPRILERGAPLEPPVPVALAAAEAEAKPARRAAEPEAAASAPSADAKRAQAPGDGAERRAPRWLRFRRWVGRRAPGSVVRGYRRARGALRVR